MCVKCFLPMCKHCTLIIFVQCSINRSMLMSLPSPRGSQTLWSVRRHICPCSFLIKWDIVRDNAIKDVTDKGCHPRQTLSPWATTVSPWTTTVAPWIPAGRRCVSVNSGKGGGLGGTNLDFITRDLKGCSKTKIIQ